MLPIFFNNTALIFKETHGYYRKFRKSIASIIKKKKVNMLTFCHLFPGHLFEIIQIIPYSLM